MGAVMKNKQTASRTSEEIVWRGILIEIIYTANYSAGMDHIEIHTEKRVPVSITQTGYKSYFFPTGSLGEFKTVKDYVRAWLEYEAKNKEWKAWEFAFRQLNLF